MRGSQYDREGSGPYGGPSAGPQKGPQGQEPSGGEGKPGCKPTPEPPCPKDSHGPPEMCPPEELDCKPPDPPTDDEVCEPKDVPEGGGDDSGGGEGPTEESDPCAEDMTPQRRIRELRRMHEWDRGMLEAKEIDCKRSIDILKTLTKGQEEDIAALEKLVGEFGKVQGDFEKMAEAMEQAKNDGLCTIHAKWCGVREELGQEFIDQVVDHVHRYDADTRQLVEDVAICFWCACRLKCRFDWYTRHRVGMETRFEDLKGIAKLVKTWIDEVGTLTEKAQAAETRAQQLWYLLEIRCRVDRLSRYPSVPDLREALRSLWRSLEAAKRAEEEAKHDWEKAHFRCEKLERELQRRRDNRDLKLSLWIEEQAERLVGIPV